MGTGLAFSADESLCRLFQEGTILITHLFGLETHLSEEALPLLDLDGCDLVAVLSEFSEEPVLLQEALLECVAGLDLEAYFP